MFRADRERGFGPMCRCGARNTSRIGDSALTRQCQVCGATYSYRIVNGVLVPFDLETVIAWDHARKTVEFHVGFHEGAHVST